MPTMPEAPPAIMPSVAVARLSSVRRARMSPAPMLATSVPALTSATGNQAPPTASRASGSR